MLTSSAFPTIEAACTPIAIRALQRVGIYSACATARHHAKRALGIVPDYAERGMINHWRAFPIDKLPPLAAGPQLWSETHD